MARTLRRLTTGPFDLGQRDYAAFADDGTTPHRLLIDRWGGPLALQVALLFGLLVALGPATADERIAGGVGVAIAVVVGILLTAWGGRMPLRVLDLFIPIGGGLLVFAGIDGGPLAVAVPPVAVVIATAIFAQRPWGVGFAAAGAIGVAYAIVLAASDHHGPAPVSRWVVVMTAVLSSGAFVHWIRSKVLELVVAENEVRGRAEAAAAHLADLSQAKSDFLARMSHELRTPLNAVLGFTTILQDELAGPLTPRQAEYLGDVQAAGLHLVDLVDDVLDLAQVEAGQTELHLAQLSIGPVVEDCARLVRERAARGAVTLVTHVAPDVADGHADARKLRQALLNVVANAVRFTPPGGWVDIEAWSAGDRLLVRVTDTGIGIAPEDQERMFDRFEQATGDRAGTGIGLSLARRFVEQHGGTLTVQSQRGEGAAFTFDLPLRPSRSTRGDDGEPPAGPGVVAAEDDLAAPLDGDLVQRGSAANRELVASIGKSLSLLAGGLCVVLAAITPADVGVRASLAGLGLVALAVALFIDRYPHRLAAATGDLPEIFGAMAVSGIILVAGSFEDLAALGYGWIITIAFAPWCRGLPLVAFSGACYAIVLTLTAGPGSEIDQWIAVVGAFLINGFTVRLLVGKLELMVFAEREARRTAQGVERELAAATAHKDDFVASMSHELRTPLNAIIGFSDVVLSGTVGPLNDRQTDYLEDVLAAGRQLLVLIDDILELARLDAGRASLERTIVDLADLARRAAAAAAGTTGTSPAPVTAPAEALPVLVDPALFEHAVSRVLEKVVRTARDSSSVGVEVRREHDAAVLAITWDGTVVGSTDRTQMFDTADEWDERNGSGVVLAITRRIAALHAGRLTATDVPGRGGAYELTVPALSTASARPVQGVS